MILRRLKALNKLVIFWVVMALSESFTIKAQQCRSEMISTVRLAENDDLEAFASMLQSRKLLSRNKVSEHFAVKGPKCRTDDKHDKTS